MTQLFASPTDNEIRSILADWQGRDVSPQGVTVVHTAPVTLGSTPATLRIVRHRVAGADHYGAVIAPNNAAVKSLPLLVFLHGGDDGIDVQGTVLLLGLGLPGIENRFVYVMPSFRSEPLSFGSVRYRSTGQPSPWDYDVDDALALVNVAASITPAADPERISVLGFSRGGGRGLPMGARDPRIDQIVEFFGPTDFFGPYVQRIAADALRGQPRKLPGLDYLNSAFIQPLKTGAVNLPTVRSELLRRSPVYFAERLPQVQVHHGAADSTVHVSQAEALIAAMDRIGRPNPSSSFEGYIYPGGTHDPFTLSGMLALTRSRDFLRRSLTAAMSPAGPLVEVSP